MEWLSKLSLPGKLAVFIWPCVTELHDKTWNFNKQTSLLSWTFCFGIACRLSGWNRQPSWPRSLIWREEAPLMIDRSQTCLLMLLRAWRLWSLPANQCRLLFRLEAPCKHVSFLSRHSCGPKDTVPSGFSSSDVLIPLADEYDPVFPNDYEKVMKRHREERQRQREQERQKEIEEREKYAVNMTHEELHWSTRINATKLVKLVTLFVLRHHSRTSCLLVSHFICKFDFLQKKERQAWRRCSQWLLPFSCSRRGLRWRWRLWEGTKKTKWVVLCFFFFLISIFPSSSFLFFARNCSLGGGHLHLDQ